VSRDVREPEVDVLIPTFERPGALAVTLATLIGQTHRRFRVVVSDQSEGFDAFDAGEVRATVRALRTRGARVETLRNLPRRGMAQQRQFLLERSRAPRALFVDDDVVMEPDVLERLLRAMAAERCGFVGMGLIGLSFAGDERPHEQAIELWEGPVHPEVVRPGSPGWDRHRLHNAANLLHVQRRLGLGPDRQRTYRVAWVGGCVLYDTAKLWAAGGFGFWRDLPAAHAGEDVVAQLRVMARFGGCGVVPSGVYHQELPTTVADRRVDAPRVLEVLGADAGG
jgi:glycosyltransferase involved in cell wall biosynthesis